MADDDLQRELRRAAEASAKRVAKLPKPLREKGEWVCSRTGQLMHRVANKSAIMDRHAWKESFLSGPRPLLKMKCGRMLRAYPMGFVDRIEGKRCDRCCDATGITRGYGCPVNDESAKVVRR